MSFDCKCSEAFFVLSFCRFQYSQSEALLTLVEEPIPDQALTVTYDSGQPFSPVTEAG